MPQTRSTPPIATMSMRWNADTHSDTEAAYTLLGDQLETRRNSLRQVSWLLEPAWVADYRPGSLLMTIVDDPHATDQTLELAIAVEFVHQYATLRRRLFTDGSLSASTTDLLLAGDILLAEAFETVTESSGGSATDRRYQQLVETTLSVTTAFTTEKPPPVVALYAAAGRVGGTVAGYDAETRATLHTLGRAIGRTIVGQSPSVPMTAQIEALHQPLRGRLSRFVTTFVDGAGERR